MFNIEFSEFYRCWVKKYTLRVGERAMIQLESYWDYFYLISEIRYFQIHKNTLS